MLFEPLRYRLQSRFAHVDTAAVEPDSVDSANVLGDPLEASHSERDLSRIRATTIEGMQNMTQHLCRWSTFPSYNAQTNVVDG